jgi:hypothetical protein
MPRYRSGTDDRDERISRLEEELSITRYALLELIEPELRSVLNAYVYCDSRDDLFAWRRWAVQRLLESADKRTGQEVGDYLGNFRALCPLCGDGPSTAYVTGFAFPDGLERHLEGSHNQHQCGVFRVAVALARESTGSARYHPRSRPVPPWIVSEPELPSAQVVPIRKD